MAAKFHQNGLHLRREPVGRHPTDIPLPLLGLFQGQFLGRLGFLGWNQSERDGPLYVVCSLPASLH